MELCNYFKLCDFATIFFKTSCKDAKLQSQKVIEDKKVANFHLLL